MPEQTNEVDLFPGVAAGPFGDSVENPDRPGSYHSTMHMLVEGGVMVPFFKATDTTLTDVMTYCNPVEVLNSAGDPIIVIAGSLGGSGAGLVTPRRINPAGTKTNETLAVSSNRYFAPNQEGIALAYHSDGSTVPLTFLALGSSGTAQVRVAAGTWAVVTGVPLLWYGCFSENGNLWVLSSTYQVRKFAAGIDPRSGTAGAAVDVGTSTQPITGMGLLARSYLVCVKPDGIYLYDIDTNRFENIWTGLATNIHPDTGKGTYTWGNNVYVPLGGGGMVEVTPNLDVNPVSPLPKESRPGATTPGQSRVGCLAGSSDYLFAAVKPFWRRMGPESAVGLKVLISGDDGANWTDKTSVATDDDPSTTFTFAPITLTASIIAIGADIRFGAPWVDIACSSYGTNYSALTYWNGTTWAGLTTDDYTALMMMTGAHLPTTRIGTDWALTTLNGFSKYWVRLRMATPDPTAVYTVREVRVLPDPVPLDGTGVSLSGYDDAALGTQILRGYPIPGGFHWDTVGWHLGDVSVGMLFSQVKALGGGRSLYCFGPKYAARFPLGDRASPVSRPYADVTNSFASLWRSGARDRVKNDSRAPTTIKSVDYVTVHGKNFDEANDFVQGWISYDGVTAWQFGQDRTLPTRMDLPSNEEGRGYEYEIIIGLQDGSQGATIPQITRVVAGVRSKEGSEPNV